MSDSPFYQSALAVFAGMAAQSIAARVAVPSIVVLLATGVLLGPDGLGLFDPAVLGSGREAILSLAVTVILFEGGLALDLQRLRQYQRSLVLLLTLGAAISMICGTMGAHLLLGLSLPIAILYGADMIVTGPTVVTPLLARLTVARPVRELLISEGVLIDPIGAIVAIVALDAVLGNQAILASGWLVVARLGMGTAIGAAGGVLLTMVLRRRWIPEELTNPSVLGVVLLVSALASLVSEEGGLMAAVAQGVVLANTGLRDLGRLREFKEALTVILLSFLFVVLAADLRLQQVWALGTGALGVVAILVWVGRPLAVLAATAGSSLTLPERFFIAWICPRGIIAAAVAGLFRILLDREGIPGGRELEALVFVTVALTVGVQGLTAGPIARLLGVDRATQEGTIIVGADQLGRLLARLLTALGRQVVLLDRQPGLCRSARTAGLSVYQGDALSVDALEEAGARYADTVIALTRNAELNALVAHRVRENFRAEHVFALGAESDSAAAQPLFPGNFPGVDEVNLLLRQGRLRIAQYDVREGDAVGRRLGELPYAEEEFALLIQRAPGALIATADQQLTAGDRLWGARLAGGDSALATVLEVVNEGSGSDPLHAGDELAAVAESS